MSKQLSTSQPAYTVNRKGNQSKSKLIIDTKMEQSSDMNYVKIVVQAVRSASHSNKMQSMQTFINDLLKIGESVSSVELIDCNNFILSPIKYYCKNVERIELSGGHEPFKLHNFTKLKELTLWGKKQSVENLKSIFESVPNLECLSCWYDEDIMQLLPTLPKLNSLWIYDMPYESGVFQHLCRFDGLTKLNIGCSENCIEVLNSLEKSNLVELTLHMPYNEDTFELIKSFPNLEVLSMDSWKEKTTLPLTVLIDLPSSLKRIKLNGIKITYHTFVALVQDLKFLEEIDLGSGGIFWPTDESEYKKLCKCSNVIKSQ